MYKVLCNLLCLYAQTQQGIQTNLAVVKRVSKQQVIFFSRPLTPLLASLAAVKQNLNHAESKYLPH